MSDLLQPTGKNLQVQMTPKNPGRLAGFLPQIKRARIAGASWEAIRDALREVGTKISLPNLIIYAVDMAE